MLATALGRLDAIGRDIVNHCVNDILVQGARPLFFLDYVASSRLEPAEVAAVVQGVAAACREAGMALLGGETAEMPGVYAQGELDLVGTIVGVVSRPDRHRAPTWPPATCCWASPPGGLQTNGFSLARQVLGGRLSEPMHPGGRLGETIGDALMAPHRSFQGARTPLLEAELVRARRARDRRRHPRQPAPGAARGARCRDRPELAAAADLRPAAARGRDRRGEMRQVFNLGVGMIAVVRASDDAQAQQLCPEPVWTIGRVVEGSGVRFLE
jgi:phosphoribosylformylglycinamidine cyclo-ligase